MTFQKMPVAIAFLAAMAITARSAPKPILGTVKAFKPDSFEIEVKPDDGDAVLVKFAPETEVVQIRPGERDLKKAEPAKMADIAAGDRVMVSFAEGEPEARRVIVISATDISKRNEAVRLDWQEHGISGVVASASGGEITVRIGTQTAVVNVTDKTAFRRYSPDSVKFADATPSSIEKISNGDQIRARGAKSADGLKVTAEEIVFGTFQTKLGTITAVNGDSKEITIREIPAKKLLIVRITADSKLKLLPDLKTMQSGRESPGAGGPPANLSAAQALDRLPAARMEDLKVGGMVLVSSTTGATSDKVTAISLLANAEIVKLMIEMHASGQAGAQGMGGMHGGMGGMHGGGGMRSVIGPGGELNLPGMLP